MTTPTPTRPLAERLADEATPSRILDGLAVTLEEVSLFADADLAAALEGAQAHAAAALAALASAFEAQLDVVRHDDRPGDARREAFEDAAEGVAFAALVAERHADADAEAEAEPTTPHDARLDALRADVRARRRAWDEAQGDAANADRDRDRLAQALDVLAHALDRAANLSELDLGPIGREAKAAHAERDVYAADSALGLARLAEGETFEEVERGTFDDDNDGARALQVARSTTRAALADLIDARHARAYLAPLPADARRALGL